MELHLEDAAVSRKNYAGNEPALCRPHSVECPDRNPCRLSSLRHSIFRERLDASRLRSLTLTACAALTRPARSRVVCNYRSDGRISDGDSVYSNGQSLAHNYRLQSCGLTYRPGTLTIVFTMFLSLV